MSRNWKVALTALAMTLIVLLAGCGSAPEDSAVQTLTAEEAYSRMQEGGVTVVDVRRADEYAAGHVPGAILIPNEEIGSEKPEALPDTEAVLLVYCRSGRRSSEAAAKLAAMGYENVYDFGGIIDWPYDVVEGDAP